MHPSKKMIPIWHHCAKFHAFSTMCTIGPLYCKLTAVYSLRYNHSEQNLLPSQHCPTSNFFNFIKETETE